MMQHASRGKPPHDLDHGQVARPVRLLLVEDSAVLAERIVEVVGGLPFVDDVNVVDTEYKALYLIKQRRIDVVLLDLHLRQGTGFGVLRALASLECKPVIVVLTNHDLPQYHTAALNLGAAQFLDKVRAFQRLPDLLADIANGCRSD